LSNKAVKTTFFSGSSVKSVSKEDVKKRVLEEIDFIKSYKYANSLNKFLSRNTKELDDSTIARLLMIEKDEVEEIYQKAVAILREGVVDSEEEDL
jgi:hypothetical protein